MLTIGLFTHLWQYWYQQKVFASSSLHTTSANTAADRQAHSPPSLATAVEFTFTMLNNTRGHYSSCFNSFNEHLSIMLTLAGAYMQGSHF